MKNVLIAAFIFGVALCCAHDDDWNHGHHKHHEHHKHHAPPFLKNVPKGARKEYYDILKKHHITIAAQKVEIVKWASKNKIEVSRKFYQLLILHFLREN